MPQVIEVTGVGPVEFPDGMSDEEIIAALRANFPPPTTTAAPAPTAPNVGNILKSALTSGTVPRAEIDAMVAQAGRTVPSLAGAAQVVGDLAQRGGEVINSARKGLAGLGDMFLNAPAQIANLNTAAYGALLGKDTTGALLQEPNLINRGLRATGAVQREYDPQDKAGQYIDRATQFAVGSMVAPGGAVKNLASGAAAGVASQGAGDIVEAAGGPRIAGDIAGAFVPAAASAAIRGAVRGNNAAGMQGAIADFQAAGTTPTVGQASGNKLVQAVENLGGKLLSGAPMREKAATQADDIAKRVTDMTGGTTAQQAGRSIQSGITESWLPKFKQGQKDLEAAFQQRVPPQTMVRADATAALLDDVSSPIRGAEALSANPVMANPMMEGLRQSLAQTLTQNNGVIPFEALRALRRQVGNRLEDALVSSDIPKADLKRLYGALSDDLRAGAASAGPDALKAFDRASAFTRSGHNRLEIALEGVAGKVTPEQAFAMLTSGSKADGTKFNTILKSLPQAERKTAIDGIFDQLGRAPASKQGLEPVWSADTFMTRYSAMSPEARTAMLRYSGANRADMDAIARVASNIKEGSKLFQNPSGTANTAMLSGELGALGATGIWNPPVAAKILAAMTVNNIGQRAMRNPGFVRWLAKTTKAPAGAMAGLANQYASQLDTIKEPETRNEIAQILQSIQEPQ